MSFKIHHIRVVRRWHGRIGFIAALFLVFLVITGLALNHGEALKLDKHEINNRWLMKWYGIHSAFPGKGYLLGANYLVWEGDKWLLGSKLLSGNAEEPVGAVEAGGMDYIATASELYIYQADGQLVDKVEKEALPGYPILALGKKNEKVVLQTPAASYATADGMSWEKISAPFTGWSSEYAVPDSIKKQAADILAPGLPAQRILLDIHSGRIFGRYGPWVVDAVAIALLALSMSGLWIYWRSVKQGRLQHKTH